jgi:glycerophosphoryl diester phosphodiesterase
VKRRLALFFLLAVSVVFVSACGAQISKNTRTIFYGNETLRERLGERAVGGHQGDLFGLKFNTISSFSYALYAGASIVEMDLRLSKDSVAVVYHDEKMNTWTNCSGDLRDKNLSEIKNCRFRLNGEIIPTFEEVVVWSSGDVIINAEFKEKEVIEAAIKVVRNSYAYEWVYFQATSWEKYELARKIDPYIYLLFPVRSQTDLLKVLSVDDPRLLIIEINENTRTAENIRRIHEAGKLVSEDSWHFSPSYEFFGATCSELFEKGIDIAITNRPYGCAVQKEKFLKNKK